MSVTPSTSESLRSFSTIDSKDSYFDLSDISSHSPYSSDSLYAQFVFLEMAPPKENRDGKEPIQLSLQYSHINYKSTLKSYDIIVAIRRSVCEANYAYRYATMSERCNTVV